MENVCIPKSKFLKDFIEITFEIKMQIKNNKRYLSKYEYFANRESAAIGTIK